MRTCRNDLHYYDETKYKQCPDCAREWHRRFYKENTGYWKNENGKWKQGRTFKECQKRYRENHPDRIQKRNQRFKVNRPLYSIWRNMISRCTLPSDSNYKRYGARGIKVSERWLGKEGYFNFERDVSPRPSEIHSLDRWPDRYGNYEPGNVRWATPLEQAQNTSIARLVTVNGITKSLSAWARDLGMTQAAFRGRVERGLTGDELIRPVDARYNRFKKFVAPPLSDRA
jgi:hypothetical protein